MSCASHKASQSLMTHLTSAFGKVENKVCWLKFLWQQLTHLYGAQLQSCMVEHIHLGKGALTKAVLVFHPTL